MISLCVRVAEMRKRAWSLHKEKNFRALHGLISEMKSLYERVKPAHSQECDDYNREFPGCGDGLCPRCLMDREFWGDLWRIASV